MMKFEGASKALKWPESMDAANSHEDEMDVVREAWNAALDSAAILCERVMFDKTPDEIASKLREYRAPAKEEKNDERSRV